ncbi:MAG: hypothetical protein H0W78_08500 [Planctomycetes bacterium]|nr:hypothetical protein [Planctomycetota bacterium]
MRHLLLALLALFIIAPLFAGDELPPVVYVPYEQTPTIDPKKQAVFLPYERFMALWEAAKPKPDQPVKPPVGATFGDYVLTGVVKGDLADLTMTGTVTGLDTGWAQVVLPATLGLSGFTPADDRLVLERTDKALVLHVRGTGQHKFTSTVAAPVTGDAAGRRSLSLSLPAAGAGRLDLLVPQADAALTLTPAVAAITTPAKDGTRLLAVLGGTAQVQISWQPPAEVASGEALILSDGEIRLTVGERSLRYDLTLDLTILRRPLENVRIALPADAQVLAVEGKDVRTWERTAMGEAQVLTVSFHQPVSGSYALLVRMERAIDALTPGASRSVAVAWPTVVGAARATGRIAVVQGEGLVAAMESATGLSQVDPGETQTGNAAVAAYRFHAAPPESRLLVTRLASDLRAGIHQLVRLGREEDLIAVVLDLDVRKAGIFALALDVPATWELVDTGGLPLDDARLAAANGATRRLDLALRGRLLGAGQVVVRFKAPPSIPREATAAAVATTTTVTVAKLVDVRQVRGTLAVATPSSWSLTSSARTGLTSTEVEALRRDGLLANLARELKEDEDLPLGFTFLGADASTVLAIAPRARELNIRHEELVSVAEGHLRRLVTLRGEVRYSAAPALRLSAPSELDSKLVFKGSALAEQTVVSRADGRSTWELRFQAPITGAFTITVEDQRDVPALTAGTPLPLTLEPLTVLDATRVSHIFAVAREGTVEVSATAAGLETVAPADLPAGLRTQGVVAGFQGAASVAVALTLVRHDLVTLADGAVTAARYLAVMSEERLLRVQGELLLSTRGRPYLELRLPAGAELLEVAIDRRQGRPSRRADGSVVIPLGDGAGLRSQVVAFVYEQRFSDGQLGSWGSLALELPRLNDKRASTSSGVAAKPATNEVTVRPLPVGPVSFDLFLPDHLIPWGWRGDVTPARETIPLWGEVLARLQDTPAMHYGDLDEIALRSDGLTVPVTLTGRRHHLSRLGDGGGMDVRFVATGLLNLLALFALLLGALAVWFARRRNDVIAGLAITAAVLVAAIAAPWATVMSGFAVGVFAVLTIILLRNVVAALRARRVAAVPLQVVTPDPWLEQPKPLPLAPLMPATPAAPPGDSKLVDEKPTEEKPMDEKPQDPRP